MEVNAAWLQVPGEKSTAAARTDLLAALATLDTTLATKTFVAGHRMTVADVALVCGLVSVMGSVLTAEERASLPAVMRWFNTLTGHRHVKPVLGAVRLGGGGGGGKKQQQQGKKQQGKKQQGGGKPQQQQQGKKQQGKKGKKGEPKVEEKKEEVIVEIATIAPETDFERSGAPTPADLAIANTRMLADRTKSIPAIEQRALWKRNRWLVKDVLAAGETLIGRVVNVRGWAKSIRQNRFAALNDGSCQSSLQIVFDDTTRGFSDVKISGGTDAAFSFTGEVVASPAEGQATEIKATEIRLIGQNLDPNSYPLAKKRHKMETLRTHAHLRPRTNAIGAVARVRDACCYATHKFFNERGFKYVHTPLITASDCEGAGEMFAVTTLLPPPGAEGKEGAGKDTPRVKEGKEAGEVDFHEDFFARAAFLTVSGQLNVECYSCSLSDVYTFGPTFRAENSHTSRHLAEFWMIEPEIAFADLEDDMNLAEDFVKFCTQYVMDTCMNDLEFFDARIEPGLIKRLENVLEEPFARITYTKAIEVVKEIHDSGTHKFEEYPEWGIDMGSEHERYLSEVVYKKPVIVTDYPQSFKAFYMRKNEDGLTCQAMDILVPKIGELIGGSVREERLDVLDECIRAKGLEPEMFSWYRDLRKYGSVPHAGFGLGLERLVMFCTGMENIRDVIPFPRYPGTCEF